MMVRTVCKAKVHLVRDCAKRFARLLKAAPQRVISLAALSGSITGDAVRLGPAVRLLGPTPSGRPDAQQKCRHWDGPATAFEFNARARSIGHTAFCDRKLRRSGRAIRLPSPPTAPPAATPAVIAERQGGDAGSLRLYSEFVVLTNRSRFKSRLLLLGELLAMLSHMNFIVRCRSSTNRN